MNTARRWLSLDQIKAGEGARDCGPAELNPFLALNLRRLAVEPAHPVHVVMLDAEGRFVPVPRKVR